MTDIAVIVPCYNEAAAIGTVVEEFSAALPQATIYVYDNNSSDDTAATARAAGAIVRREPRQGKGNVVRRMFADIEADVYVLVDGDATYSAAASPQLVAMLQEQQLDMVVGAREATENAAYRPGHRFGNRFLTACVGRIFGQDFADILSGYRVFSRRFVKSFPALTEGFEIETELTVHALRLRLPVAELSLPYAARPEGSHSKLSTWRDGFRILRTIIALFYAERPLTFFGLIAIGLALMSLLLATPLLSEYLSSGLVPRLPTAILCTGLMILAALSAAVGLVLRLVAMGRREMKRLAYLQQDAVATRRND